MRMGYAFLSVAAARRRFYKCCRLAHQLPAPRLNSIVAEQSANGFDANCSSRQYSE